MNIRDIPAILLARFCTSTIPLQSVRIEQQERHDRISPMEGREERGDDRQHHLPEKTWKEGSGS